MSGEVHPFAGSKDSRGDITKPYIVPSFGLILIKVLCASGEVISLEALTCTIFWFLLPTRTRDSVT